MEAVILWVLAAMVLLPALWLTIGALENLFHPAINETFTTEVMDMARLRADYPEAYDLVAYRRVTNPALTRAAFRLVVGWEILSALALWIAVIGLFLAALGLSDPGAAMIRGLVASAMFTATWCGFLVVGNWYCYWFGHEGAQVTHFHMTLWGFAVMILLMLGFLVL
ncbi:MAG: DUF2165 family protein [Rhodobacteraceae bacterium]|nr:DUF2165 family protein [Paracoccaceae bacterium]